MTKQMRLLWCLGLSTILTDIQTAQAEASTPDLSGTYRCVPDIRSCRSPTFVISQFGSKLNVKSEQGEVGTGEVTSNISVSLGPPWNALGIILPDQRTIEWSGGTQWQKQ